MKKLLLLFVVSLFMASTATAQTLANLPEGYYRLRNVRYSRYMSLQDNTGYVRRTDRATESDLFAIRTLLDNDNNGITSNPATVIHISGNSSAGYICSAQGVKTTDITSYRFYISNYSRISNSYYIYAQESGVRRYLSELSVDRNGTLLADSGSVKEEDDSRQYGNARYWYITPIESNTDNYFGFSPKLQSNGKYYQTFYAEFPFRIISSGVKVYYISNLFWRGNAVYREYTEGDVVPAETPLIVECSSSNASENKVQPVLESGTAVSSNYLRGVYFDYFFNDDVPSKIHENRTAFNPSTMRVLRVQADGTLAFVNNPTEAQSGTYYLPANEAYLSVPEGTAAVLPLISYADYTAGINAVKVDPTSKKKDDVYTIGGVKVTNDNNLPHGVYIQGGKKVVK